MEQRWQLITLIRGFNLVKRIINKAVITKKPTGKTAFNKMLTDKGFKSVQGDFNNGDDFEALSKNDGTRYLNNELGIPTLVKIDWTNIEVITDEDGNVVGFHKPWIPV